MILDSKGERGGYLFSNTIYSVSEKFAKKLVDSDRAVFYDEKRDAKRMVNLDSVEMTWGEYLKLRRRK